MGHSVTLGGERLGAGKTNKIHLKGYERSTHDMGYVWRSTMASGTLVPFLTELGLPGDTFDINLNADCLTHPTIGPLFGHWKIQLDVFQIPIRLYQAQLHMNALGIGMNMSQVKLPQLGMYQRGIDKTKPIDNQQINPSCLFSYLNIRGTGFINGLPDTISERFFNAIPYLAYWDIYKQYYSNKQEEIGSMIHQDLTEENVTGDAAFMRAYQGGGLQPIPVTVQPADMSILLYNGAEFTMECTGLTERSTGETIQLIRKDGGITMLTDVFNTINAYPDTGLVYATGLKPQWNGNTLILNYANYYNAFTGFNNQPLITTFPLKNIDDMRMAILQAPTTTPFLIRWDSPAPYGPPLIHINLGTTPEKSLFAKQFAQEGLALKTYQSDLFNNWINTEWIDGADGISEITKIDTTGGSFKIDELLLNKKIYDMLNRIALSGGTYNDWMEAVYDENSYGSAENPMYVGGLMKNLVFQEVVSTAQTNEQPIGTLAGKGRVGSKHKGGHIIAKIKEPSYIMGIVSLTPIIDYSQGNKWDVNLRTMNDFHKPQLDEIGFQDLITDQMAWFDTTIASDGKLLFKSAGKQPAWINYMTNVNQVRGNFADESQQMFMVLNRRYTAGFNNTTQNFYIKDLTTYIDPLKFNYVFADTRRDAQNFWMQIGVDMTVRRKMSAKVIPNL
ncbi:MAG: major capsid protein [Microviridae sp.]|nr:MAG: major capsid protein [Microviridae sp.]